MDYETIATKLEWIAKDIRKEFLAPPPPPPPPPPQFEVGDLVRSRGFQSYRGGTRTNPPEGHVGVVRRVDSTMSYGETVLVEWAFPWVGHSHRPETRRPHSGWWMNPDNLEPA